MADDPGPGGGVMLMSTGAPNCAAFSPDGALLALAAGDSVHLVEVGTWVTLRVLRARETRVLGVAFSPDGTLIAAVTIGDVRAWDAATGEHRITLTAPPGEQRPFRVAFFSPDGVLSVMRWPLIEAFDVRTGTRLDPPGRKLPPSDRYPEVSPDGTRVACLVREKGGPERLL
jgi:WD40 repeat protein